MGSRTTYYSLAKDRLKGNHPRIYNLILILTLMSLTGTAAFLISDIFSFGIDYDNMSIQGGKGIIFLGDDPDEAAKKIMSAATDSVGAVHLDYENQPGISNLLQLHALLSDETLEKVAEHHDGQQSYGDLKKEVAEQVYEFLADFQERLAAVDDAVLMQKLESDERAMNEIANATLLRVQKAVGLRPSSS